MPYCEGCGEEVSEDAQYCSYCGESVDSLPNKQSSKKSPRGQSEYNEIGSEDKSEDESRVQTTGLTIAIVVFGVAVVLYGMGWEHATRLGGIAIALTFASLMGWT